MADSSKLHELLAVENDLESQATICRADLKKTFETKTHHFSKKLVTFKPKAEGEPDKVEGQLALQTTVAKELSWIQERIAAVINTGYHIDLANTEAKADVVLDDAGNTVILKGVPTTGLLRLGHRLTEIRDLVAAIPTLDPAKNFQPDNSEGEGIYKARDAESTRTEKRFEFVVMVQPTDKHPAQVEKMVVDRPSGTLLTQEWSSMIQVSEKGKMLDRVEALIRAVKKARARANNLEVKVKENRIGDPLLDYVFKGKV